MAKLIIKHNINDLMSEMSVHKSFFCPLHRQQWVLRFFSGVFKNRHTQTQCVSGLILKGKKYFEQNNSPWLKMILLSFHQLQNPLSVNSLRLCALMKIQLSLVHAHLNNNFLCPFTFTTVYCGRLLCYRKYYEHGREVCLLSKEYS